MSVDDAVGCTERWTSAAPSTAPSAAPSMSPSSVPSAGPSATPSRVLWSGLAMPPSGAPGAEPSAVTSNAPSAAPSAFFEQRAVSWDSSYAFECTVVCAVCVSKQRGVSWPKHQQRFRVYYGLCRRGRRQGAPIIACRRPAYELRLRVYYALCRRFRRQLR